MTRCDRASALAPVTAKLTRPARLRLGQSAFLVLWVEGRSMDKRRLIGVEKACGHAYIVMTIAETL